MYKEHTKGAKIFFQTSPIWDILLFGAVPNVNDITIATNNCKSINNALLDNSRSASGIVSIPKGLFYLWSDTHCISIQKGNTNNMSNTKIIGEGVGVSILQLYQNVKQNIFRVVGFSGNIIEGVEFHNLSIFGNGNTDEQAHCVLIGLGKKMKFSNVEFAYQGGDGIKVVGNIDNNTSIEFSSEITIVNCKFHHLNRNGITVQYGASKVIIDNNEFEENEGDIDMEPTSDDGITPYSVIISNNSFSRLVPKGWSISLSGKNNPYSKNIEQRFILTNNIIKNGGIWTYMCKSLIISDNIIEGGDDFAFQGIKINSNFVFNNNIVINNNNNATQEGFFLSAQGNATTKNIELQGNKFINCALNFENCHDVVILDNNIDVKNTNNYGIRFNLNAAPCMFNLDNYGNVQVVNNQITQKQDATQVPFTGILFSCQYNTTPSPPLPPDPYPYPNCNPSTTYFPTYVAISIDNNRIESDELEYGIRINVPGNLPTPTSAIEYWQQLFIGKENIIATPTIQGGEKISVFGSSQKIYKYLNALNPVASQWLANGNPEGLVSGQQGTTAIDKTREADNKYQLNSIDGNTGWTLIREMGRQVIVDDEFTVTNVGIPLIGRLPDPINVVGSVWNVASGAWELNPKINSYPFLVATATLAQAIIQTKKNGELKAIIELLDTTSNGTFGFGIIFRHNNNSSYWRFYFEHNISSQTGYYIKLEAIGSSGISFIPKEVNIGESNIFTLMVKMKGDIISVYYNELAIWSFISSYNNNFENNGLIATQSPQKFSCHSFKHLL